MQKKHQRVYASINLDAVEENFENMKNNLTPGTKMIAVVKADAYGHGAVKISRLMQEKDYIWGFAVAAVEEAEELRENGIKKPILILGYAFREHYETLVREEIRPAVFSYEMAKELSETAGKLHKILPIHLAVDTGMTRIGFRKPEESLEEIIHISKLPNIRIEGMFTHFARADEEDLTSARNQFEKYRQFLRLLSDAGIKIPVRHCNNSAGILWHREGDLDAVRPGITIYGVYPSEEVVNTGVSLTPVMELKSHISHVKDVEPGVAVSYGGTFVTHRENTRIATIPVGYADGYPRSLSNKGCVLIQGKRAEILGRVCMDQFMVDVTDIPEAVLGAEVTLLGKDGGDEINIGELAAWSQRFPYEFLCCISKRVPRVYISKKIQKL
ncbi:MAG: alanine racemase [Clostridiales bacterium]|nr:alanine racemase [Clostridiales bacterium]